MDVTTYCQPVTCVYFRKSDVSVKEKGVPSVEYLKRHRLQRQPLGGVPGMLAHESY